MKFNSAHGFWGSVMGKTPPVDFLDEIATSGEQLAIPFVAPLLVHKTETVRDAAARCITHLFAGVASSDLPEFEQVCRLEWASNLQPWRSMSPSRVGSLSRLLGAEVLIGIASFHNSGWVREAAVNALSEANTGAELPFLLLRLNDWVPEIRRASTAAVVNRLTSEYAADFLRHLRLVLRLKSCGRDEHALLIGRITELLKSPESFETLSEGFCSQDRWLRREAFKLAIEGPEAERLKLVERMLSDEDALVRVWAARDLLPKLERGEARRPLELLSRDRFPRVRCEALTLWASASSEEAMGALEKALLDSHGSVRALARYWIGKLRPNFDFAKYYRESLRTLKGNDLRAAALGLGETGEPRDAEQLLPYLRHEKPGLRKAAIRSMAVLSREAHADEFMAALGSQDPGISREAANALKPIARSFEGQLLSLYRSSPVPHVRRNIFPLLLKLPYWRRGIFLFEAIRDSEEKIINLGQMSLKKWLAESSRMASVPTPDESHQLRASLKASRGMLEETEARHLEFILQTL